MTYLSRDAILQREDIKTEDVEVPEWGGTVRVRGMTGVQRDAFEASLIQQPETNGQATPQSSRNSSRRTWRTSRAKLTAWCCVDDQGGRLFAESDVQALGGKSAAALARIFDVATRLSGITEEDVDEMAQEMVEHPFDETSTP